jgi:undecaprenyl-diphosphatase
MWERLVEFLKVVLLGIVEGVTEWLPVSSTGHMLLLDEYLSLKESPAFKELFFVVIQLSAVLAVPLFYGKNMIPFHREQGGRIGFRGETIRLWGNVCLSCLPGAISVFLLKEEAERIFHRPVIIASALIFYGLVFLLLEGKGKPRSFLVTHLSQFTWRHALGIGAFQILSLVPGTSRSGATILGALLLGVSREAAAEFSFWVAMPVMLGYSSLRLFRFGFSFTFLQQMILLSGCAVAFLTSLMVIRFLTNFVKNHSFRLFGWYRIALGAAVLWSTAKIGQ